MRSSAGSWTRWPCSTWATWPRTDADPDALCLRAELLSGQRLHEGGGTVNLSADEWLDRWRAFRRQSPAADIAEPHVDVGAAPSAR